jgi:succinylglutamate desuccinylase
MILVVPEIFVVADEHLTVVSSAVQNDLLLLVAGIHGEDSPGFK